MSGPVTSGQVESFQVHSKLSPEPDPSQVVQMFYRRSSIEMQRLESLSRAPLISHYSETLSGIAVIRAYRAENRFLASSLKRLDDNNRSEKKSLDLI